MTPTTKPGEADLTDEQLCELEHVQEALRQIAGGDSVVGGTIERVSDIRRARAIGAIAHRRLSAVIAALGTAPATPVPASNVQARAMELHEKAAMPWSEAERLALSESGTDDAAVDELIGECGSMGLETLLADADSLRDFTRSVLVHQPLATPVQPVPASEPSDEAIRAGIRAFQSGHNGFDDLSDWRAFYREVHRAIAAPTSPAPAPATQADAAEVGQWRPIESAPKDMASRLYWVRGFCVQGFVDAAGELNTQTEISPHWRPMRGTPTHWMPLPAAPADSSMGGGER